MLEAQSVQNSIIWTKEHQIPARLTQLRQTIQHRTSILSLEDNTEEVRKWLRGIVTETEELYALLSSWYKGDKDTLDIENIIYAILEHSQSLLLQIDHLQWFELKTKIYDTRVFSSITPFPECMTVLIYIYGNLKLHTPIGVRKLPLSYKKEWVKTLQDYRKNEDDVSLMTYVAKRLNYFAKLDQYASEIPFPPEYRDTILSPDGKTDWSYAVWCIYQELKKPRPWMLKFNFVFDADILTKLEVWLKSEDYFSHPHSPRERSPSRTPIASTSPPRPQIPGGYRKVDLSELLNELQMLGQCSS